nr:hypothetical protein [uncultured Selenomonas sp.]
MIISKHGKSILLSLFIASTLSSDVSAETIVRTERTHKQASIAQDKAPAPITVNVGQADPSAKSPTQNAYDNTTVSVEDDTTTKEDSESTAPNSGADIGLASSTENTLNENTLDDQNANSSKQKNLRYIEGFKVKGPAITTQSQDGFFLYTSKLYEEHEQYGGFTLLVQKYRNTATLGPSDIATSLTCSWSMDFDALINKNHKPRFIVIANDGSSKIIELNMYSSGAEYFSVESPKWGNILQNVHKLYLEISSQSGDNIRLPIPTDAVEQWNTVVSADMKKLKKEFENK